MTVNILAVGDVTGKSGLDMLVRHLNSLQRMKNIAFTVVNGENASGLGITPRQAEDIYRAGADVITLGNHTWARQEIRDYLDDNERILRPANYTAQCPGRGFGVYDTDFGRVCVMNLVGRYSMDSNNDNPFTTADRVLGGNHAMLTLVDMHAEATSERLAMGYYLDGRVSAVWGTHTHVQTSDAGVLPNGTGYISDLGMTGPVYSVLGIAPERSISMFLGNPPARFEQAAGPAKLECAVFEIDVDTGRCLNVEAVRIED